MLFLKMIRIVLKERQIVFFLVYRILFIDSEGEERQEPNQIPVDPEFPDFLDFSNSAKTFGTIFYQNKRKVISFLFIHISFQILMEKKDKSQHRYQQTLNTQIFRIFLILLELLVLFFTKYKPHCLLSYSSFFHMYDLGVSCTFHFHKKIRNHP